jgi:hypothetical protein
MLAQEQEQRRLREAFHAGQDAPAAVLVPTGARPSHLTATCKTHM